MLAFDAKRAFLNTSGLGNYSRTHLLNLRHFFPSEDLLLFTTEAKIPFIQTSDKVTIIKPKGIFNNKAGAAYWRSYRIPSLAEYHDARVYHGLSNELPLNIHKHKFKKIVTIHDLIFEHYPEYYKAWDRKNYHMKVRYCAAHADEIICISEQTKNDLRDLYKVPENKLRVIYQDCSDIFRQTVSSEQIDAARQQFKTGKDYIISIGTPEPRKQQKALVEAAALLNSGIEIIFIGKKTAYQAEVQKLIQHKKLQSSVRFINDVHGKDLVPLLKGALFSVYLSEYEGFGLPIVESLNMGIPVLSSNRSCLPEAAGPGAVFVDPDNVEEVAEGMKKLLNDSALRSQLGEAGKKHVEQFQAKNTIMQWKEVYGL